MCAWLGRLALGEAGMGKRPLQINPFFSFFFLQRRLLYASKSEYYGSRAAVTVVEKRKTGNSLS